MSRERLRGLNDEELGAAIRSSPPAWPATPPLDALVAEWIRRTQRPPQLRPRVSLPSRRRTVLIVIAAVALLAATAVAARLVVDIGAETIEILPGAGPTPPSDVLSPEVLGNRASSPAEAAAIAGFEPVLPVRLGDPSGVWTGTVSPDLAGGSPVPRIVLAWRPTPALPAIDDLPWGAVLMQFRGRADVAAKSVFEEAAGTFRPVTLDGRDAFWVTGEHVIELAAPGGGEPVELRVTGQVLVWQQGDLTLRLETSLGLPAALEVAGSATPGSTG